MVKTKKPCGCPADKARPAPKKAKPKEVECTNKNCDGNNGKPYRWTPRVKNPKQCPWCHQYLKPRK